MIVDNIKNARFYYKLGEKFEKAFRVLEKYDGSAGYENLYLEKADIPVDGDRIFIKVRPYDTRPASACSFEAHRRYADIHFVAEGCEKIGYADISNMRIIRTDEQNDMIYLEGEAEFITLRKGFFMIVMPYDVHMPGVIAETACLCSKLIAKVKLEEEMNYGQK
jgi:YhcH/YjgK/YiaL family protein